MKKLLAFFLIAIFSVSEGYAKVCVWGNGRYGILGPDFNSILGQPHNSPTLTNLNLVEIHPYPSWAFGKTADGHWYGWGTNVNQALDKNLPSGQKNVFYQLDSAFDGARFFGKNHTIVQTTDEKVYFNFSSGFPTEVPGLEGHGRIAKVADHPGAFLVLFENGEIYGMGYNFYGELGIDSGRQNVNTPTQVTFFADHGLTVVDIGATDYAFFFLTSNGKLYSSGRQQEVARAASSGQNPTPGLVTEALDNGTTVSLPEITEISSSRFNLHRRLVVKGSDGQYYGICGAVNFRALGYEYSLERLQVLHKLEPSYYDGSTIIEMASDIEAVLFHTQDGRLWYMGDGDDYFHTDGLGDGNSTNRQTPKLAAQFSGPYSLSIQFSQRYALGATSCNGTAPDQPPVAEANGPYSGATFDEICLSSAGSTDPDGSIVSWHWIIDGPNGYHNSDNHESPCFIFNSAGNYTAELTVTDNDGLTASDTASITVVDDHGDLINTITISNPDPAQPPNGGTIITINHGAKVVLEKCHPAFYLLPNGQCSDFGMTDLCSYDTRGTLTCGGASNSRRYGCLGSFSSSKNFEVFFDSSFCKGEGVVSCELNTYDSSGRKISTQTFSGQCQGRSWIIDPPADRDGSTFDVPAGAWIDKQNKFHIWYSCHGECHPQALGWENSFSMTTDCPETLKEGVCLFHFLPNDLENYPREISFLGPDGVKSTNLFEDYSGVIVGPGLPPESPKGITTSQPQVINGSSGQVTVRIYLGGSPLTITQVSTDGPSLSLTSGETGSKTSGYFEATVDVSCSQPKCLGYVIFTGHTSSGNFTKRIPVLSGSHLGDMRPITVGVDSKVSVNFDSSGIARIILLNDTNSTVSVAYPEVHGTNTAVVWSSLLGDLPPGESREILVAGIEDRPSFWILKAKGCKAPLANCTKKRLRTLFTIEARVKSPDVCAKSFRETIPLTVSSLVNKIGSRKLADLDQVFGTRNLVEIDYKNLWNFLRSSDNKPQKGGMVLLLSDGNLEEVCK